nr:PQQ-dependent membrane bound dehydrogenase, glucose/quinate/shikimate-related [Tanacetum cinerariifolium]
MSFYGNLASVILPFWLLILVHYAATDWVNHGRDITNGRYARDEFMINPSTVHKLKLRWKFLTGADTTATPAVADGVVYFPAWNGFLYAVNAFTGDLIWKQNLTQLTGLTGTGVYVNVTVVRATPVVARDLLIVGIYGPAVCIAVSRLTGQLVWSTTIDPRPLALITASGTVYSRGFYVGVSSLEETLPAGKCCTFRGSIVMLDIRSGAIQWQAYTVPDNGGRLNGYSGGAIWGSSPAIDVFRKIVYVATGNLYTAPPEVIECQAKQNNQTTKPDKPDHCTGPDVMFNSIIAFDASSGKRDIVVAVQKSGFVWALDRDNGNIVWFKLAGPGSNQGGGIWGAATDGNRIYTNIANGDRLPFTLAPSNQTTTAGAWVALDANTGQILWTTADPSNDTPEGPVSLTRGVMFAGSVSPKGPLYALDARTGSVLWSYETGATIYGGASASYGCIYVGHGYTVGLAKFHNWTPGSYVFAFCIF